MAAAAATTTTMAAAAAPIRAVSSALPAVSQTTSGRLTRLLQDGA
jgi:hypothetical protein